MDFVDRNYDNFIITYSGEPDSSTAIRFDPKNDDVKLTGEGWHSVESKAQLDDIFRDLDSVYRGHKIIYRGPYLFEIQTKEGRGIGYLYCLLVEPDIRQEGNNIGWGLSPGPTSGMRETFTKSPRKDGACRFSLGWKSARREISVS